MRGRTPLALLLLLGCAPTLHAHPRIGDAGLIAEAITYTVQIRVSCPEGDWAGSGVIISPGVVATAFHVIAKADPPCTILAGGEPATRLAGLVKGDLGLVAADTPAHRPLCFATPFSGMPVIATGYPRQRFTGKLGFQVSRGHVIARYGIEYRVSASSDSGGSGGPVFDESGCLVGILTSVMKSILNVPIDDHYYMTSARKVEELYAAYQEFHAR